MSWKPAACSRLQSFAIVTVVYGVGTLVAAGVLHATTALPTWQRLALADLAGTLAVFAGSVLLDNSSVYDPYWSVAPMLIAPWLWLQARAPGVPSLRATLATVLVLAWGVRLTCNWARGWRGLGHEDWRYADMRPRARRAYWLVSFVGFHLMPTVSVYLGCLSLLPAVVTGTRPLGLLDLAGLAVATGAIALEGVADAQLRAFRAAPHEPGAIMARGLWAYVRHPNYLGEISFWWGLLLLALAAEPPAWWLLAGPLWITALFVFISVPLIDRRSRARRPGYDVHMAKVPALLPDPFRTPK